MHIPETFRKPIVVVGSINMDLVARTAEIPTAGETVLGTTFHTYSGGKGANQAVAVARLGYPVHLIGCVGRDAFAGELRDQLKQYGVAIDAIGQVEGSSGVALIAVAQDGENSIVVVPGANSQVTPERIDSHLDLLRQAGLVLAQLEIPIESVVHLGKVCADLKVPLILDPAPATKLPHELLSSVTWFTPNESEAAFFAGSADTAVLDALRSQGLTGIILKLGARGAHLCDNHVLDVEIHAYPTEVVDTTAAGDCFNGAFATALMLGMDPEMACQFAAAAASISVSRAGAQTSMPTLLEVRNLLASAVVKASQ